MRDRLVTHSIAEPLLLVAGITFTLASGVATRVEAAAGHVVISEIQTSRDGGIADPELYEFIELYNPTPEPVSIAGWSLQFRYGVNPDFKPKYNITSGVVQPYGYFLFCRNCPALGVTGVSYDAAFSLEDGAGTVFLMRNQTALTGCSSASTVVDRVAYGSGAFLCPEAFPAPAPPRNFSIERLPATLEPQCGNGTDTAHNNTDFVTRAPAQPQNSSSAVEACADLEVAASDAPDPAVANQTVTYTVTVNNLGPHGAPGTLVTATLSSNLIFLSTTGCVNDGAGVPTCDLGHLAPGAAASFSIQARVAPCSGTGDTASILVRATAQSSDPDPDNSAAVEETTLDGVGTGACDDGNVCTTDDACSSGECAGGTPHPGATCDDGNACTTNDHCDAAGTICAAGSPLDCDDGIACTADSCDPALGCVHVGGPCNDQNACTFGDHCTSLGTCFGTPITCQGEQCADGVCNPATGQCELRPTPGRSCFDGILCTSPDVCDANGQCAGPPIVCDDHNPCTADSCHNGHCNFFPVDGNACDDGNACTRLDQCNDGSCTGVPLVCYDDNSCTLDRCYPATGCEFTPQAAGASCFDGNTCTEGDTCDAELHCVPGAPVPAGSGCNDNDPCTAPSTCDASGNCLPGSPSPDSDGDGRPDSCDCNPQDPGAVAFPPEVTGLGFLEDKATLIWGAVSPVAGSGTTYDVYYGYLRELPVGSTNSTHICLGSGIAEASFTDDRIPAAFYDYWYLVRASNSCGQGVCGTRSDGFPVECFSCP